MKEYTSILLFFVASFLIIQSCSLQKKNENMRVVSFKKVVNKKAPDYEICNSFYLKEKDISKYFTLAEEVEGHEFHRAAVILLRSK